MVILAAPSQSTSSAAHKGKPSWKTNLKRFGVTGEPPGGIYEAVRQMAFGDNDEIVVLFPANQGVGPGEVIGVALDRSSGQITHRASWQSLGWQYVFGTREGQYAVVTTEGTALYSRGLKSILARNGGSVKLAAPDGASLAVWRREQVDGVNRGITAFLDTKDLRPLGIEYVNKHVDSISRTLIANTGIRNKDLFLELWSPSENLLTQRLACNGYPQFVSNEALVMVGSDCVEVMSTTGERLFQASDLDNPSFAAASRDGRRFAIVEALYAKGIDPGLKAEKFTVFGVHERSAVFSTMIKELREEKWGRSGAALSPDGSALAVNSLGVVQLFVLSDN
ncbi:MAG: hypothetical protein ACREAA_16850 [Candidatus Polarisedimenticolia bacterium]